MGMVDSSFPQKYELQRSKRAVSKNKPSIERTKEFFPTANLSDKEAEDIRDIAHMFAELAYDSWDVEQKKNSEVTE